MSDEQKAIDAKNHGNAAFSKGNFAAAIKSFSVAIELQPTNHQLYSNRSAAYIKLKDYAAAQADGEKCLELAPEWGKGYSRLGTALSLQQKYSAAVKVFALGITKDPEDRLLTEGLAAAQKHLQEKKEEKDADQKEGVVIGIDLGTTFSCVGVWEGNGVKMIPNDRGDITTPSYISFDPKTGKRTVGQAAKAQAALYPTNTIYDVKRIIGQRFHDEGVEQDIRNLAYPVVCEEASDKPLIQVDLGMHGKKTYAPEEMSAMVLSYLKKSAEKYLGHPVTQAVVTVPAYFNDSQRAATKAAGRIAGLDVLRIINEPTAAALSYGLDLKRAEKKTNVLIFDLGGGTFDVSILSIENGVFEVLATGGDTRLGGEDFDNKVLEFVIKEAIAQGIPEDFQNDAKVVKRLRVAVEKCKRQLSNSQEAEISVEGIVPAGKKQKAVDFTYTLTRQKFDKLNQALFLRCLETVQRVLKDAKMKKPEVDEIVLVGGSTRIPKIQEMLQDHFDGKALCKALNPDEAVAYGAAVQGAILNGTRNKATDNLVLMDVTPLSLGIETTGKVMSVIIPRNTPIPATKTQVYTTEENFQTQVDICVYEGERLKSDQNNLLGKFTISGIERAKRGEPKVDVTFSLDSNGILSVTAKDQKTGAEANIIIENRGRASEADIQRMVAEAAQFRKEDEARAGQIEAKNELEAFILEATELAAGVDNAKLREALDTAINEAQEWLDVNGDTAKAAEIKLQRRTVERALQKARVR